jgi:hypothetical protein
MPDWLLQAAGMLFTGGILYGAIKQDLKAMHENVRDNKETAKRAHVRIDDHIDKHHIAPFPRLEK